MNIKNNTGTVLIASLFNNKYVAPNTNPKKIDNMPVTIPFVAKCGTPHINAHIIPPYGILEF